MADNRSPRKGTWQRRPSKSRIGLWALYWSVHAPFILISLSAQVSREVRWLHRLAQEIEFWLLLAGGVIYLLNELRIRRHVPRDRGLSERPEGLVEYPVEAIIMAGQKSLGLDRGTIYFEEGRIGFVGSSFSFLLAPEDIVDPYRQGIGKRDLLPGHKLVLNSTDPEAQLVIRPLLGYGKAYRKSLKQFFSESGKGSGLRQCPPLTKYVEPAKEKEDDAAELPGLASEPEETRIAVDH